MNKYNDYQNKRRNKHRKFAIDYLGGHCKACNTKSKLQFDHIDPESKKYTLATIFSWSTNRLTQELDKCQLLCFSCHQLKTLTEKGGEAKHGTISRYVNQKCRCLYCTIANTVYYQAYRKGLV